MKTVDRTAEPFNLCVMRILLVAVTLLFGPSTLLAQAPNIVSSAGGSYTLRPGDVVRITVWGREDFSGQFQVDELGQIQYPVLGEIDLKDREISQVRAEIRDGLSNIFNQPFVTITPLFRIAVLGNVQSPGLFTVDPTLSVLDIVAMAGGPNNNGNINKIKLLRGGEALELGLEANRIGGQPMHEIGVRSGDQIVVPKKTITATEWQILIGLAQVALSVAILINTN